MLSVYSLLICSGVILYIQAYVPNELCMIAAAPKRGLVPACPWAQGRPQCSLIYVYPDLSPMTFDTLAAPLRGVKSCHRLR